MDELIYTFIILCFGIFIGVEITRTYKEKDDNECKKYEIKECPFCGNKQLFVRYNGVTFYIECDKCHVRSREENIAEKAIEIWNKRIK